MPARSDDAEREALLASAAQAWEAVTAQAATSLVSRFTWVPPSQKTCSHVIRVRC